MEKIIITVFLTFAVCMQSKSQEDSTIISTPVAQDETKPMSITMNLDDFNEMQSHLDSLKEENNNLQNQIDHLQSKNEEIAKANNANAIKLQEMDETLIRRGDSLTRKIRDYEELNNKIKQQNDAMANMNKKLFNIAVNFLFIPYEAYSIEEIAFPAIDAITSDSLKKKREHDIHLLKSYQADVRELAQAFQSIKKLMDSFYNSADTTKMIKEIESTQAYARYKEYHYRGTSYLGKKMDEVLSHLSNYDYKRDTEYMKTQIDELNKCLETIKDL